MILTAMAMYLNTVHSASFDYWITFIGDMILAGCISISPTIKNIIRSKEWTAQKIKETSKDKRCIFWKGGKCNSDYAKGLRCGGYAAIPKDCPYNKDYVQLNKSGG